MPSALTDNKLPPENQPPTTHLLKGIKNTKCGYTIYNYLAYKDNFSKCRTALQAIWDSK